EILERVSAGQRATTVAAPTEPRASRGTANLGSSSAMRRVDELIDRIADADVPVLITGESGVGKDVVAREIHSRSSRAGRVFVKINCAALPGELLESRSAECRVGKEGRRRAEAQERGKRTCASVSK